jgi:hypothetical protein
MGILDWIKRTAQKVKKGWNTFKEKALPVIGKVASAVTPARSFIPGVGGFLSEGARKIGQFAEGASGGGGIRGGIAAARKGGSSRFFQPSNTEFPMMETGGPPPEAYPQEGYAPQ